MRARRTLMLFIDVPLRTRRALLLYNVYGDSTLLVLNGTLLNSANALLALIQRYDLTVRENLPWLMMPWMWCSILEAKEHSSSVTQIPTMSILDKSCNVFKCHAHLTKGCSSLPHLATYNVCKVNSSQRICIWQSRWMKSLITRYLFSTINIH